ncbi:pre-mRNA-splicing factor 38B-like isoform X2 [Hydractinia symbiolongicarpus]|uniref:pre-mRNA-splicing factor 38B-like isoform X2 n=1 Tax=Hydractinia symbiolongicarpus TaxID=13093 RepID=UPI00254A78FD|nr:pre-mRNA-splicing factor 38B-like isoform X2 [Hydractinia symbiolongicarpus]
MLKKQVAHLEPWEKGSRKTHGQVGMCGGVRGVGAGGIVSSGYCLLFKLFTMKLTQKQLYVLLNHTDSPYIRGLGFMYIRYCLHPNTFWEWFEPYLEDDEEIDPKAGEGSSMTIGQMVRSFLLKLDWYGTLFPRIPVPIQKEIESYLKEYNLCDDRKVYADEEDRRERDQKKESPENDDSSFGEAERYARKKREEKERSPRRHHSSERDRHRHSKDRDRHRSSRDCDKSSRDRDRSSRNRDRSSSRRRSRSRERSHHDRDRKRDHDRHSRSKDRDHNSHRKK